GWNLTNLTCNNAAGTTVNLAAGRVTATLSAGQNVTCTYTDTLQRGRLTVNKVVVSPGPGNTDQFALSINGSTITTTAPGANGTTGSVNVTPPTATFGEAAGNATTNLANYTTTVACVLTGTNTPVTVGGSNPAFTVNVGAGQDVTCTITNTLKPTTGKLRAVKALNLNGGQWPNTNQIQLTMNGTPRP